MKNTIESIALEKLVGHPDNANEQSRVNFGKLVRNIKRTGRYEPLVVRACPERRGFFQIINGHHRCRALTKLGYNEADCVVWDVDDEQTDILLATLNRLGGSDNFGKKLELLRRLNKQMATKELGKLLPVTTKQIERLVNLKRPSMPAKTDAGGFASPTVFFLSDAQQRILEDALSLVEESNNERTKAGKKAAALVGIAQYFLDNGQIGSGEQV